MKGLRHYFSCLAVLDLVGLVYTLVLPGMGSLWGDTQLWMDLLRASAGFSLTAHLIATLLTLPLLLPPFFSFPCLGARVRAPYAYRIRYFYL